MLALAGQPGDWCLRDDQAVAYVLTANDYTQVSSWTSITAAGSAVTSINGQVGDVTLSYTDVNGASSDQGLLADSAVQPGDAISTLSNDSGFISNVSGSPIGELSNVTVSSATAGKVLRYNGTNWVDAVLAYTDLSGTPTNVSSFTNDAGYLTSASVGSIDSLSDISLNSPSVGEVLRWNGTQFVNTSLGYTDLTGTPTNVSTFTNDSNYITSAQAPVQTVNGQSGTVVLASDDIDDSLSAHKFVTSVQSGLINTSVQPGDNISTLTNDVAFITSASVNSLTDTNLGALAAGQVLRWSGTDWVNVALGYGDLTNTPTALSDFTNDLNFIDSAGAPVQSINTQTGAVVLDADDIDDTSTLHKFVSAAEITSIGTAVQPGDNVSVLVNNANYINASQAPVQSINTQTGTVVLDADDIDDTSTTHKFVNNAQIALIGSATQPGDNVSDLTNDANYIDAAGAPVQTVNTQSGNVVLDADDIDDTSTTNKFVTSVDLSLISTALQSGDNVSDLTNDANYIDAAGAPVQSVAGKTGAVSLVKGDVGLGNVDNTADLDKPISTLTQTALDGKADLVGGVLATSQLLLWLSPSTLVWLPTRLLC